MNKTKEPRWKSELKEILAISGSFFVIFVLFLLMKKAFQENYDVNFYVIGTSPGGLINYRQSRADI